MPLPIQQLVASSAQPDDETEVQLNTQIPKSLMKRLKIRFAQEGYNQKEGVLMALTQYLDA